MILKLSALNEDQSITSKRLIVYDQVCRRETIYFSAGKQYIFHPVDVGHLRTNTCVSFMWLAVELPQSTSSLGILPSLVVI